MARRRFGHEGNLPLFPTESGWKAPSLSDLPDWSLSKVTSLDTEFYDPTLRELGCGARREATYISGYSFMLEGHKPFYVPVRHPEGNIENPEGGMRYLADSVRKTKGTVIMANGTGDLDILETKHGIKFDYSEVKIWDITVVDPLIWELYFSYSQESIGQRRKIVGKDKSLLKKAVQDHGYDTSKKGWERAIPLIPARFVGPYGEMDAAALHPIRLSQLADIQAQGLDEVVDLECRMTPLLLKMRQRGIRIDQDHLDRVEQWAIKEELETLAKIKHETGYDIGFDRCNAAAAVAPALQAVGIQLPLTAEGQWSITTEILSNIDHPIGELVRYLRQVNKIRRTFVKSIRKYQTNGRIHGTFRQVVGANEKNEKSGAAFGRLSHAHPNTAQQPSRGKHASFWRDIYLPEEGQMLCSSDFSAQEPRWVAHFSSLLGLTGADKLAHEYNTNPRIDPHSALASMIFGADHTKEDRTNSKTVYLATSYCQGGAKLCKKQLKLPTRFKVSWKDGHEKFVQLFDTEDQAIAYRKNVQHKCTITEVAGVQGQAILDKFHAGAPFVKELSDTVIAKVERAGMLKILGGRVLHFRLNSKGEYEHSYKGLNRLIQGSAGYQTKLAMLALDRDCPEFWMCLQIHDEVVGSITDIRVAKIVGEIMRSVVSARVPFRCEAEVGPSLGSLSVVCNHTGCTNMADKKDKFGCKEHALVAA
jgi:DNA polymerase I-like protein with 3'-5' exonuclease and polymerase domains